MIPPWNKTIRLVTILSIISGFGIASYVYTTFINNSIRLTRLDHELRLSSRHMIRENDFLLIRKKMKEIVDLYINEIESEHILDGMITHRRVSGEYSGLCDSLLFSSIYYVSLRKLGYESLARQRWSELRESQISGNWFRHPRCLHPPPSRDMILGLLMSLSQKPESYADELRGLLAQITASGGFFGEGNLFVSYLLPGVAENIRRLARSLDIPNSELPSAVREGFSTMEWSVAWTKRGYRSHLHGLNLWLEEEVVRHHPNPVSERTAISSVAPFLRFATIEPIDLQRMNYVAQELYEKNPKNLFFKILRFRTAEAWSDSIRFHLIQELLAMSSFPHDRLPNNCDRKADYLWQRADDEATTENKYCTEIFNGVDFLWAAALLYEEW